MSILEDYRSQHPEYSVIKDSELLGALYKSHYADSMTPDEFLNNVYPSPDLKRAEQKAVKAVAGSVSSPAWMKQLIPGANVIDPARAAVGIGETLDTGSARLAKVLSKISKFGDFSNADQMLQSAARNRELSQKVTGGSADVGRALPAMVATAPLGGGVLANAAAGAASGALTADNPLTGAITGGVLGGGLAAAGKGLGAITNSYAGKFAERPMLGEGDIPGAMEKFQSMGGRFTPGEADPNSKVKSVLDWVTTRNPLTTGAYHNMIDANQKIANQKAAAAIGVEADHLGPSVLRQAKETLGQKFSDVINTVPSIPLRDASFADELKGIANPKFLRQYGDEIAYGTVTPETFLKLRSELADVVRTNKDAAPIASDLLSRADDAFNKTASPEAVQAYANAREQWKNLVALKSGKAIRDGNLMPTTAADKFTKVYGDSFRMDTGKVGLGQTQDLFDVLHALSPKANQPKSSSKLVMAALAGGGITKPVVAAATALPMYLAARTSLGAPSAMAAQMGGSLGAGLGTLTPDVLDLLKQAR